MRFLTTIRAAAVRDRLGRSVKKSLLAQLYAKLLRLGVRETKNVKMAGLTQLATEGIEQLDLYCSAYLPLIPVSIAAVSHFAKRIFARYWGKYTAIQDG